MDAPNDAVRGSIMPINRKYDLAAVIDACRRFPLKTRARITFEYVLLAGVNDSERDAAKSAGADFWLKGSDGMFDEVARLGEKLMKVTRTEY